MESTEKRKYKVIVTDPAEVIFYEILDYLYDHYTLERAEEIATELRDKVRELHYHPDRGTHENQLAHRTNDYRYILYRRTSRNEIKVIYFIDKTSNVVYVTDFHPTEMDDQSISKRNR